MPPAPRSVNDQLGVALGDGTVLDRLGSALKTLRRRRDLDVDALLRLRADVDTVAAALREVADRIDEAEAAEASRQPFGDAWWNRTSRELRDVSGSRFRALWTARWVEALSGARYDRADQLADLARENPDEQRVRGSMREISSAFVTHRRAAALPALVRLADRKGPVPAASAVPLLVLLSRLHLRVTGDTAAALFAARQADARGGEADLAVLPDAVPLALAALAEAHLERGELDAATEVLDRTRSLPATIADPLIVGGVLAQRRGNWRLADALYDEAVEREGERATQPRLLRPAPPNLLWRMARHLRRGDTGSAPELLDRALTLIDQALDEGVVGAGEYPERQAYVEKARILDRLGRPAEAGAALADAATRYALADEMPRAIEVFERACTLAPESAAIRRDYADALRAAAEDDDTVVDVDVVRRASELVREGVALQQPGEGQSWVFASEAMLAFTLNDVGADPALLLERSLLLSESAPVYAALAAVLRLSGYPTEAEGPARRCVELSPLDGFATDALAAVLADRGEYEQALALLTSFLGLRSGSSLPLRAGAIHLCSGDPRAAIEAVADEEPSDTVLLIRGAAHELAGEQDVAIEEYELVRAGEGSLRDRAWAAYRTGSPDDAVDLLTELAAEQPRDRSFTLDFGVMLIAQGNVEQGDAAIRDAIERCTVVGELVFLAEIDLRALRRDGADGPLSAVLDGIADHVERRCATLRAATRPSGSAAVRAARARAALGDGDLDEALDRYRELLVNDEIAEAESGLARAAEALMKRGDSLLAEDRDAARAVWGRALIHASPPLTDAAPVLGHLRARIALVNLEAGERVELDALVRAVGDTGGDAAAVVARDVPSVWHLHDALGRMTAGQPSAEIRARLDEVRDRIPLGPAYRLAQKEVPEAAVLPLVTPLEMRLPPDLEHLIGAQEFRYRIPELRRRLAAQTGVRIPGVRVVAHPAGTERGDDVTFRVYDQVVHRLSGPDRPDDAAGLLEAFERVVRTKLYRTLVPADVPLWLDGWDDDAIRPVDGGLVDAASRLRLVRVLRMLLREEVPITDRSAIVAGFQAAEDLGSAGPWRTLEIVRGRLPADALRGGRTSLAAMPEDLERRICSGLDADRSSWAMEATAAAELLADLREWQTTLADDVAVTVQDPDVRPFVWRLLASAALPGPVLTGEEVR